MRGVVLAMPMMVGLLAGCGPAAQRRPSLVPASTAAGTVTLRRIDPPEHTVLRRGQKLSITVTAEYELNAADSGAMLLTVQDQAGRSLVVGSRAVSAVKRGRGETTMSTDIVVPEKGAKKVVVYVPLTAEGYLATSAVGQAQYKISR